MKERSINTCITDDSISLLHPLTEDTLLSWKLSHIISIVYNKTEFSFSICSKCDKFSGHFAQQVSLETGIFVVSSIEERLADIYPEEKVHHEKTISGDLYRVPHSCGSLEEEVDFTRPVGRPRIRTSKFFSFPLSCISAGPSKLPKLRTPLNQPKYKRCPTPTSFTDPPLDSPSLPFTRHSSMPPGQTRNYGYDTSSLYLKSAITSPVSVGSSRPEYSTFHPSQSQEDLLSVTGPHCLPKSPSLNAQRYIHGRPTKPSDPSKPRPQSHLLSVPPIAPCDWNYTLHTTCRSRHGSLGDHQEDVTDSPYARKSLTPIPNASRIMYTEETLNKLSIISELEKSLHTGGHLGYESHSLPIRRRRFPDHRPRAALRSNTFQFPIGVLPVTLAKEPNFSEGGKIIINNTEYQVPRMIPEDEQDSVYDPHLPGEGSDPSSDTSASTPPGITGYPKQKRYQNHRKPSHSSTFSSTTLSEALPYSQDDSDSGPDRITMT